MTMTAADVTIYQEFEKSVRSGRLVAMATILSGPALGARLLIFPDGDRRGGLGDPLLEAAVQARIPTLFATLLSERLSIATAAGPVELFVDVQPPQPRLWIVGAVHIAVALVTYARALGFYTIVIDPRTAFATPARFPHADELIARWPDKVLAQARLDESACVVVLTHDEKIDNPALIAALRSPARYVGALGSRRTHAKRSEALKALGAIDAQIARIHAPIGLNIAARRPEEIALAIMAEIVAVMNGAIV
jgi:xanthine dehydrogenase accessory factor